MSGVIFPKRFIVVELDEGSGRIWLKEPGEKLSKAMPAPVVLEALRRPGSFAVT